jgi:hypothetical protein
LLMPILWEEPFGIVVRQCSGWRAGRFRRSSRTESPDLCAVASMS